MPPGFTLKIAKEVGERSYKSTYKGRMRSDVTKLFGPSMAVKGYIVQQHNIHWDGGLQYSDSP